MTIENCIVNLFQKSDIVSIPAFGTFTKTRNVTPRAPKGVLYPPKVIITFAFETDKEECEKFIQFVFSTLKLTPNQAKNIVKKQVDIWKIILKTNTYVSFEKIGKLYSNGSFSTNIDFFASFSNFGLSVLDMQSQYSKPKIKTSETSDIEHTKKKKELSGLSKNNTFKDKPTVTNVKFKPAVFEETYTQSKKIAPFWMFIITSILIFTTLLMLSDLLNINLADSISLNNQDQVKIKTKNSSIEKKSSLLKRDKAKVSVVNISTKTEIKTSIKFNYYVVASRTYRFEKTAKRKVSRIKNLGYKNASYLGLNKSGNHQVFYDVFKSYEKAKEYLRKVYTFDNNAWLLAIKN